MYIPKPSKISVRSLDDVVHLYYISDIHAKERGFQEELLKKHVEIIRKDPCALVVLGGDHASYICTRDKRMDFEGLSTNIKANDLADWAEFLINCSVDLLYPIKNKIILAIKGNHETKYTKMNQQDVHKSFCDRLGIFNGGYTSVFCLRFIDGDKHSKDIIVHIAHGKGNASTPGGVVNKLKKYSQHTANSDIVLIGHMHHQISVVEKVFYYKDGLQTHYKTCICPGSYLESYNEDCTTYGEEAGYSPPIVGCARIDIIPKTKEIQIKWMK